MDLPLLDFTHTFFLAMCILDVPVLLQNKLWLRGFMINNDGAFLDAFPVIVDPRFVLNKSPELQVRVNKTEWGLLQEKVYTTMPSAGVDLAGRLDHYTNLPDHRFQLPKPNDRLEKTKSRDTDELRPSGQRGGL
eukprot:gene550-847_t